MVWQISIDTGGTFTDAYAIAPDGRTLRNKVLSSGCLLIPALAQDDRVIRTELPAGLPDDFFRGFTANGVSVDASSENQLVLDRPLRPATSIELSCGEEAPVLAIRLLTETPIGADFPELELRLGTTRGTNALLQGKGARVALFCSPGFRDLLAIGDQRRPDLFALEICKPDPLPEAIVEHHDLVTTLTEAKKQHADGIASVAIALKGSYLDPAGEAELAAALAEIGFDNISVSSRLAPLIKLLPRTQTAAVDAYLAPILRDFIDRVRAPLGEVEPLLMTSAGGLVPAEKFHAKDSLLSEPAGGVAGAIAAAGAAGIGKVITFDMGGTSTDVARCDGVPAYQFEQKVGRAQLLSPSLKIETVAAGGGSICSLRPTGLCVGPESAGADPGPACYGRGGPLTLTDVNLLLGHIEPSHLPIPIDRAAAEGRLRELQDQINPPISQTELLDGLREIATQRMAEAIRKITLREGFDPAEHTLVAFGGAGPQHACALAEELGISSILIPADAGLLSAFGIHRSQIEKISQRQILAPLADVDLARHLAELRSEATGGADSLAVSREIAELRLAGQETAIQIECGSGTDLGGAFVERFAELYGYPPSPDKPIELVSLRTVAASPETSLEQESFAQGSTVEDPFSTLVVDPGWHIETGSRGSRRLTLEKSGEQKNVRQRSSVIEAELFRHRFASIVEEMGTLLQRTAVSTNIKERADFSCAILDARGQLVMSAPHIPVHLGALGECVRAATRQKPLQPGDMLITNHPASGGSHLPDITLISPVFVGGDLIAHVANRAHHAEIGGICPGSMPADARCLAEEGTVIPPTYLFKNGRADFDSVRTIFESAPFPTRNLSDNLADLHAQAAANLRGVGALAALPADEVLHHLETILDKSTSMRLQELPECSALEKLDDGSQIAVAIRPGQVDFSGTTPAVHPGNLNATSAIVRSAVLYVLRLYLQEDIPLNEGILKNIEIKVPDCFLAPRFTGDPQSDPAVVGGNVETSQRIVDTLIKALGIQACSQGTMNNFIFGNDHFGYYETIAGGTGAGLDYDGASAVHSHMTNTAITDPEILESRYPVRLRRFAIRRGSGGNGSHHGGDGVIREFEFLEPLSVSMLTQHRTTSPFPLGAAAAGMPGKQTHTDVDGDCTELPPTTKFQARAGDRLTIETPGGGGASADQA